MLLYSGGHKQTTRGNDMKMLLSSVFGLVLAMFGISVIDRPLEACTLILLYVIGIHYDEIISLFKVEK